MSGVDLFCGFGGTTEGARRAGQHVRFAVNHSPLAIGVHKANHPETEHFCGDVFNADPRKIARRERIGWLWLSADCTHHSRLKGGKPRDAKLRALADVAIPWLEVRRPEWLFLENVQSFVDWGPLLPDGQPDQRRKGEHFDRWLWQVRAQGYRTDMAVLSAADFGAPTSRERFFLVGRRGGGRIEWPTPTHGPGRLPHRSAGECIDWSVPVPSIFEREKPYSPATMRRVARALNKHVLGSPRPYLVPEHGLVATLIQTSYGERVGQAPRVLDIRAPLGTVVAGGNKHALVCAYIVKHYGGNVGRGASLHDPLSTVTCVDHHALATAIAVPDARPDHRDRVQRLIDSDEDRARYPSHLTIAGQRFDIVDVGMRPLTVRERARAQGFQDDYILDRTADGQTVTETAQGRMVGNAVPPQLAEHLLLANVGTDRRIAA